MARRIGLWSGFFFLAMFALQAFAAVEWIHVITATKVPQVRGSESSAFEQFEDGYDPNVGGPFGPDKETMFLPVTRVDEPVVNPVLQKYENDSTAGVGGPFPGTYIDPGWVVDWVISSQDLGVSKALKTAMLIIDFNAHMASGWTIGPYVFPLTQEFMEILGSRRAGLSAAIDEGDAPANATVTFSDMNDAEVSVNLAAINANFSSYFIAFQLPYEKLVSARNQIALSANVVGVDAVVWSF